MIYRSPPHEPAPLLARRAPLWRRARASLRGLPLRLEMRRAWLALPAEVRLVLRGAGLRRKLLDLAGAELLAQATARVAAAWRYERAVEAWERSGWRNVEVDGKVEGRRTTHPVPDPQWISRTPSDMQRAVACSATSVPEAVEALREGLWEFWLMNMVSGR